MTTPPFRHPSKGGEVVSFPSFGGVPERRGGFLNYKNKDFVPLCFRCQKINNK